IYMIIVAFGVAIVFPLILVMSLCIGNLTYVLLWSIAFSDIMIMFVSVVLTSDSFMKFLFNAVKVHIVLIAIGLLVIF
ncbi:MAG: hypothetical protein LUG46_01415, partial [Erysipelotrichaceae bacterium]|nr:hypothetical protein [Erysipelotrichaceae bacterium]